MKTPCLVCENLTIGYTKKSFLGSPDTSILVKDLNASFHKGQMICILGINGVGKSTLLRVLSGQQKPLQGKVCLGDKNIHAISSMERAYQIAVVYAGRMDPGFMTVSELLQLGRYPYTGFWGKLNAEDLNQIRQVGSLLTLTPYLNRYFNELSDGEAQRVQIGRALVQNSTLFILDEPTAFLDPVQKEKVMSSLQQHTHEKEKLTFVPTHDLDLAMRYADQFLLLSKDGRELVGKKELQNPQKLTQFFVGCDLSYLKSS